MSVRVRFFAILREAAGRDSIAVDHVAGMTVGDVVQILRESGVLMDSADAGSFVCAVNHEYAAPDQHVVDGDEIALIPPVSGG